MIKEDITYDPTLIKHLKLVSGEEIVGEALGITKTGFLIMNNPMKMNITITNSGVSFFFTRWQPMAKYAHCHINLDHVISQVDCKLSFKSQYESILKEYSNEDQLDLESDHDNIDIGLSDTIH